MKIGIMTGGGDAPGLNAVIRAVTVRGLQEGYEIIGFERGWYGVLNQQYRTLDMDDVEDIHTEGGTILFSSRTNVRKIENGYETAKRNLKEMGIDVLVAAGGEDTLGVAKDLSEAGYNVIGAPKTIDNDVNATDVTFGFDTAINRVMRSIDEIKSTTKAHQRVMVLEIMGRHAGWMALHGGLAGGAHVILLPEEEFVTDEVCAMVKKRYESGKKWAIIAVAEGATDPVIMRKVQHSAQLDDFGHIQLGTGVGIGQILADEIQERTGCETRHLVLGHSQRAGRPTAFDRVLGTRIGIKIVEMVQQKQFGMMAALRGSQIVAVPLADAVGELKTVPKERFNEIKPFFG